METQQWSPRLLKHAFTPSVCCLIQQKHLCSMCASSKMVWTLRSLVWPPFNQIKKIALCWTIAIAAKVWINSFIHWVTCEWSAVRGACSSARVPSTGSLYVFILAPFVHHNQASYLVVAPVSLLRTDSIQNVLQKTIRANCDHAEMHWWVN